MPPDSTRLGRLRRYNFPPHFRAKGLLEDTSLWELLSGTDYDRNYDNSKEQTGANLNSPVSK